MFWCGFDIGGTLVKMVYFKPTDSKDNGFETIIDNFISTLTSGENVKQETKLDITTQEIGGKSGGLYFLQFPGSKIKRFLGVAKATKLCTVTKSVSITGGGAFKYEEDFKKNANLSVNKIGELDCLLIGAEYIVHSLPTDGYMWKNTGDPDGGKKVMVKLDDPYPYMVVNMGTATGIMIVRDKENQTMIGATTIGGSTFLGLCCALTGCTTFEEALALASNGDNRKVDTFVKDIYGGGYERIQVDAELVCSSFGRMAFEEYRVTASKEDLAKSALLMAIQETCFKVMSFSTIEDIKRIVFGGNFLRGNDLAMQLISSTIESESSGTKQAIFLEHGGYLCALGCLLDQVTMETNPDQRKIPSVPIKFQL